MLKMFHTLQTELHVVIVENLDKFCKKTFFKIEILVFLMHFAKYEPFLTYSMQIIFSFFIFSTQLKFFVNKCSF